MSKLNLPEWAQKIKFKEDEVKIIKWVQSLNFNQRNYMKKVIEDAAAAIAEDESKKKFAEVLDWLGLAMSAKLIDKFDTSIAENGKLYEEYKKLAEKENNVIFGGRLGEYKYYDMDAVIAAALDMSERELG